MLSCCPKLEWQLSLSRLHPQNHQRHIGLDHEPKVISLLEWPCRNLDTLENHTMTDTWQVIRSLIVSTATTTDLASLSCSLNSSLLTFCFFPGKLWAPSLRAKSDGFSTGKEDDKTIQNSKSTNTGHWHFSGCPHDRPAPKLLLLVLPAQVYFLCNLALRDRLSAKANSTRDPMKSWIVWVDSTLVNI